MKIKADQIQISIEKITKYLLVEKEKNDKSKFLFGLGYSMENWKELLNDIKYLAINNELILQKQSDYGDLHSIRGKLKHKKIITIWLKQINHDVYRFITLYPDNDE